MTAREGAARPSYGLDAPLVVAAFGLAGLVGVALLVAQATAGVWAGGIGYWLTPVGLLTAAAMAHSSLRGKIRLRDRVCRTPWCDAPVRHLDHVDPAAAGGATSYINGEGLCEACNHYRQAAEWAARVLDDLVEITTPTGHRYRSLPPPVPPPARLPEPRFRLDWQWNAA